jgi:hypothetical protein
MTAAIAAIAAITTITAVAITAAAAATAAAATLAGRALFAGTGDVHRQGAALEFLVMEHFHGLIGLIGAAHLDKGKSAGFTGEFVEHDIDGRDNAGLGKIILQVVVHGLVGQIAYE